MNNRETEKNRAPGNTDTGRKVSLVVMTVGLTAEALFVPPDSLKRASEITLAAAAAPFVQGFIRGLRGR